MSEQPPPTAPAGQSRLPLSKSTAEFQAQLERQALQIRDLVLQLPPLQLLGGIIGRRMTAMLGREPEDDSNGPNPDLIKRFQVTLEYVHAIWSTHSGPYPVDQGDDEKIDELMEACSAILETATFYAMASSADSTAAPFGEASRDFEFHAKSSWILIRGHRYQVLEGEFFRFVLAPHDEAFRQAYGIGAEDIAKGMQDITDSFRMGLATAAEKLHEQFDRCHALMEAEGLSMEDAAAKLAADDPAFSTVADAASEDLFLGGTCNVSKHTNLPEAFLRDLAYDLGEETKFFAPGPLCGTPFRALPARAKPLIKLPAGYYATDGQFVRDSAYRAIQFGLIKQLPDYKESWNAKQKAVAESAFPRILAAQLRGARIFEEVFFKDPANGQWAETDLVGVMDDVLFVVEAKAGVMAMHSPATSYNTHVRTIQQLVVAAYEQCRRFLEYVASADAVPLFRLESGTYHEVARIRQRDFRNVFPIGLTVESFTPFSSMCKVLPNVQPILGAHPFTSMSVDDLFVLNRFLPTAGELFHYLAVRQQVADIPKAMVFDEIDHLGSYVSKNRFDINLRESLAKADFVSWAGFSHIVDRHFEGEDWATKPVPSQPFPPVSAVILRALDQHRPNGWMLIDRIIRDGGEDGRGELASLVEALVPSLRLAPYRRIMLAYERPLQIWLTRDPARPFAQELRQQAQIACLIANAPSVAVLVLQYRPNLSLAGVACAQYASPSPESGDYASLRAEAEKQRLRIVSPQSLR